jgi:eukaryotic-like serine/threonine-protein kinase
MRITLTVTAGPNTGRAFSFARHDTFLVGRSKQAHFQLPPTDRYFSRIHFLVEVNPPHCRLMDMGSFNGTHVNGVRVTSADLHDGDEVRAGHSVLRVSVETGEVGGEPMPPTVPEDMCPGPPTPSENKETPPPPYQMHYGATLDDQPFPGYQVLRELGRGGMGLVSLARRLADGELLALKSITPAVTGSRVQIERFLREASILRDLGHPNVVAFRDLGYAGGRIYFAMEYVPGIDGERLVKEGGPLPVARAVSLTCQVLAALAFAHARGFVHRDVKPANVLVTGEAQQEVAKLADFGLARIYQASQLSGLTLTGEVGGTPAYMAPEQIMAYREVKPTTDQYATAATLYYLLTGEHVYDLPGRGPDRFLRVLQESPVPILSRRPNLPKGLVVAIHRGLERDPAHRFPGASEFRKALEPFRTP